MHSTMTQTLNPNQINTSPNYLARRVGAAAVGVIALAAAFGIGNAGLNAGREYHHNMTVSNIPTPEDIKNNPGAYVERTVQPSDQNITKLASEYTPDEHRIENNVQAISDQLGGRTDIYAGSDKIMVPATTVPVEERAPEAPIDTPDGS